MCLTNAFMVDAGFNPDPVLHVQKGVINRGQRQIGFQRRRIFFYAKFILRKDVL